MHVHVYGLVCVCVQSATMSRDYVWARRATKASIYQEWRREERETEQQREYKAKINGAGQGKIITHTSDAIGLVLVKADMGRNRNDQMKNEKRKNMKCKMRDEERWNEKNKKKTACHAL